MKNNLKTVAFAPKIIKKTLLAFVSFLFVFFIVSCNSGMSRPVNSIMSLLEKGDYIGASEKYQKDLLGNGNMEYEMMIAIRDTIYEKTKKFNEGECSYNDVSMYINSVSQSGVFDSAELGDLIAQLNGLKSSKEAYDLANKKSEQENWKDAYISYSAVIQVDTNFDDALAKARECAEKYKNNVIAEIESMISSEKFTDASSLIEEALEIFPMDADIATLQTRCLDVQETVLAKERLNNLKADFDNAKKTVSSYLDVEDYPTALDKLFVFVDSVNNNTKYSSYIDFSQISLTDDGKEFVTSKLNEESKEYLDFLDGYINGLIDKYRNKALKEAESTFGTDHNYAAALKVINLYVSYFDRFDSIISTLTDNRIEYEERDEVKTAIAYYDSFIPVVLNDVEIYTKAYHLLTSVDSRYLEDMDGIKYDKPTAFCPNTNPYYTEGSISYYLNGRYDELSFVVYMPKVLLSLGIPESQYLKVYGDDVLLYEAPKISKDGVQKTNANVDVTGVVILRIETCGLTPDGGIVYCPAYVVADAYLRKK